MDDGEIAHDPNTGEIAKLSLPDPIMEPVQSDPPSDWREKNYLYDPETDSYTEAPPDPDTAYDEIEQLIIDAFSNDGSSTPELDAMELINRYPAVVKALERENYKRVSTFLAQKIKPNEAIVDDSLESDINNVLKV